MTIGAVSQSKSRNKWEILFLIWVAYFLNQADRQAFNVVLPLIQEDLGLSASELVKFSCFYK